MALVLFWDGGDSITSHTLSGYSLPGGATSIISSIDAMLRPSIVINLRLPRLLIAIFRRLGSKTGEIAILYHDSMYGAPLFHVLAFKRM